MMNDEGKGTRTITSSFIIDFVELCFLVRHSSFLFRAKGFFYGNAVLNGTGASVRWCLSGLEASASSRQAYPGK
jgi:uncharacterized membrane protein YobD (UPF0266 family)